MCVTMFKRLKSAVRNGFILLAPLVFICGFYGCGMGDRTIAVNTDTTNLLPREIAIDYLNTNSPCSFTDKGMKISTGEVVNFENLFYGVNDFTAWYVYVWPEDRWDARCNLILDVETGRNTTDDDVRKAVTALTSLGIRHYKIK